MLKKETLFDFWSDMGMSFKIEEKKKIQTNKNYYILKREWLFFNNS